MPVRQRARFLAKQRLQSGPRENQGAIQNDSQRPTTAWLEAVPYLARVDASLATAKEDQPRDCRWLHGELIDCIQERRPTSATSQGSRDRPRA